MAGRILVGDCREMLRELPDGAAHCCVTSPPYWGLRDYGVDGQIGLEQSPAEYVAEMVAVFREVWRVLRDDGTLWLNLGSSYSSGGRNSHGTRVGYKQQTNRGMNGKADPPRAPRPDGYKDKDLVPIPWLVALALQADGWYLRSDIIWSKPNPMPSSVQDRPTPQHEYVFLLSKRAKYAYDAEAVKENCVSGPADVRKMAEQKQRIGGLTRDLEAPMNAGNKDTNIGQKRGVGSPAGRNLRSVWTIATAPCPAAHFATYPEALVVPCIKAGTSERGCCPKCGKQWERVIERTDEPDPSAKGSRFDAGKTAARDGGDRTQQGERTTTRTLGFHPACLCDAMPGSSVSPICFPPVPCTVLDPFFGAGTTGLVAAKLGRDWIGIELNPEYAQLAQERIDHGGDWKQVEQAKAGQERLLTV